MTAGANNAGVTIGSVNSSITFEDEVITARPLDQIRAEMNDIGRIRDLLRPIIVDLLSEEMSRQRRMRK